MGICVREIQMDADLEMIERLGTDDEGDLFEDPLAAPRGIMVGVVLEAALWLVIVWVLLVLGFSL